MLTSLFFQMIYKKTQLPCPLPFLTDKANISMNISDLHNVTNDDDDDMCTPKYFVFNSQVSWRKTCSPNSDLPPFGWFHFSRLGVKRCVAQKQQRIR